MQHSQYRLDDQGGPQPPHGWSEPPKPEDEHKEENKEKQPAVAEPEAEPGNDQPLS